MLKVRTVPPRCRQKQEALDRVLAAEAGFAAQAANNSRHAHAVDVATRNARSTMAAAVAVANAELVAARNAREDTEKDAVAVRAAPGRPPPGC